MLNPNIGRPPRMAFTLRQKATDSPVDLLRLSYRVLTRPLRFPSVNIRIKLMGMLKDKAPADGQLTLSEGATIQNALEQLEISVDSVHVFTVNGTLQRDKGHAKAFLTKSRDRILYGTDAYDRRHLDLLGRLDLDKNTVDAITWRNAARLVPI